MLRRLPIALYLMLGLAQAQAQAQAQAVPAPITQISPSPLQTTPQGSTPVPDPTLLTTQASEKAVAALKELFSIRIEALEKEIKELSTVLSAANTRTTLRLDQFPGEIDARLLTLKTLVDEKFIGVGQQFAGRDVALAAALLAQKTSVDEQNKANAASSAKSESATTKQIDGITSIITASQKGNDDKIDALKGLLIQQKQAVDASIADLKDRITAADGRAAVERTAGMSRSEGGASVVNIILVVVSMVFGLIGAVGAIFAISANRRAPAMFQPH